MCLLLVVKEKTLLPTPHRYRLEGRRNDIFLGSPETIIFLTVN